MTDEELIARLRDEHVAASRTEAADRIEALRAEVEAQSLDNARLRGIITTQGATMAERLARAEAAEAQNAALTARVERLTGALKFYAAPADYKAPFTGGMGKLWNDCGGTARASLSATTEEGHD